jgi:hypothetical protein
LYHKRIVADSIDSIANIKGGSSNPPVCVCVRALSAPCLVQHHLTVARAIYQFVVVAGTFVGSLGLQRPDKVHHFQYPLTALGDRDGFVASFYLRDGRDIWTTRFGADQATVSDLRLGTMSDSSALHMMRNVHTAW